MRRWAPAIEGVALLAVTLPLAVRFSLSTLWFLAPFALITVARRPYEHYGLSLDNPGSWRFHVAVCIIVFGAYAAGYALFAGGYRHQGFHPALPPDFAPLVVNQMLAVGLSEEFFFRGYLQTQFNHCLGRPWRFLGASWGPGLIAAAVLFGVCHLVTGDITRLQVVFFGLFVGWLRERTGTIVVPALYHGAANILQESLHASFRA